MDVQTADETKNEVDQEEPTPSTVVDTSGTSASDVPVSKATDEPTSASKPMKVNKDVEPEEEEATPSIKATEAEAAVPMTTRSGQ